MTDHRLPTTSGISRVLLLLLALLALAAVSWWLPMPASHSAVSGPVDETLVIVSPHWDGIKNEFTPGFARWYKQRTGRRIGVEWLDVGGTSDCVRYVRSEFKRSPDAIGVDLFFGGGTDPHLTLKDENLLAKVHFDSSFLANIPQSYSGMQVFDPDSFWYGAALSGFGIVYNKTVARYMGFQTPRQWSDLADPAYFTWVGAADPRRSGTMHLMFEIILQGYGWEQGWKILAGLAANTRTFQQGANEVAKMVAKGDMAFGLCIDFYGWAEVSEAGEDKIGMVFPENLTVISADAIGMLKGAPNAPAARAFMEYVLSEDGQKLWFLRKGEPGGPKTQELNRMSVRRDFYTRFAGQSNITQNPFAKPNELKFDHRKASKRWAIINDLAGVGVVDRGKELKKRRARGGEFDGAVPVTEAECLALAATTWRDPIEKNRVLLRWHEYFGRKYR